MRELCARNGLIFSILAAAAVISGCDNAPPGSASRPAPELPPITLDTPENAARTVLVCLRAELRAVANCDEQTAEASVEQLRSMVATEAIEKVLSRVPQFEGLLGEDLVKGYIRNWGSTIAYYAEGFHLDRMRRAVDTPAKVSVVVPATGPEDDALIQVTCVPGSNDGWRIMRVEFITETATSATTSQPASEP